MIKGRYAVIREWDELKAGCKRENSEECLAHLFLPPFLPPSPDHPHSLGATPAVCWLVCSYIRGQSCGMPGWLWDSLMATTQEHKGKEAGFDTYISRPPPLRLHHTATGVALPLLSAHTDSKVERASAQGRNSHTFTEPCTQTVYAPSHVSYTHAHAHRYLIHKYSLKPECKQFV